MTTHSQRALILYRRRRFINHLLTYLLTYLHNWFCHNGLALNSSKSESILFGTWQRLRNFPLVSTPTIAGS